MFKIYQICRKAWWARPQLQPVFGHRQSSWIELFFDLMFVAAISVLNQQAFQSGNALGITQLIAYFLSFLSLWLIWMSVTYFSNWFEMNSVRHRFIIFANILSVGFLTFGITTSTGDIVNTNGLIYILGFVLARLILIFTWRSANHDGLIPAMQKLVWKVERVYWCSLASTGVVAFMLVVLRMPTEYGMIFWSVSLACEFIALPIIFAHSQRNVTTIHRGHMTERFGLFTMLLLGEMIINALNGFRQQPFTFSAMLEMGLGLTIIFGFWWVYYDQVLATAFRETGKARVIWTTVHFVFALATVMMSANFYFVTETLSVDVVSKQWLIGGVMLFFITISMLHYTLDYDQFFARIKKKSHPAPEALKRYVELVLWVRYTSIAILFCLLWVRIDSALMLLSIIATIFALNAFAGLSVWLKSKHHLSTYGE